MHAGYRPDPPRSAPRALDGLLIDVPGPDPTALARHLDRYLEAVARELQIRGVLTGTPQRTDPAQRLLGSIVIDCTATRVAAWTPSGDQPTELQSPGAAAIAFEYPAPVVVTWDEYTGWCAGLHNGPTHSSRRYLHSDLLPAADTVAEFIVGLAQGHPLGSVQPITITPATDPTRLRLVR